MVRSVWPPVDRALSYIGVPGPRDLQYRTQGTPATEQLSCRRLRHSGASLTASGGAGLSDPVISCSHKLEILKVTCVTTWSHLQKRRLSSGSALKRTQCTTVVLIAVYSGNPLISEQFSGKLGMSVLTVIMSVCYDAAQGCGR